MQDTPGVLEQSRERRRHKRTSILLTGWLFSGDRAVHGVLFDLSSGGARIKLSEPLNAKSAITLRLAGSIDFHIETAWEKHKELGLKFREAPELIASIFAGLLPEDCLAA